MCCRCQKIRVTRPLACQATVRRWPGHAATRLFALGGRLVTPGSPPPSPPPSPTPSPTPSPSPLPKPHQRCCNWCGSPTTGPRPYCDRCATAGRECRACHRPMPPRFYTGDNTTCIACTRKRGRTCLTRRLDTYMA